MLTVSGLLIFPWRRNSTVGLQRSSAPPSFAGSTGRGSTGGSWRALMTWSSSTGYNFTEKPEFKTLKMYDIERFEVFSHYSVNMVAFLGCCYSNFNTSSLYLLATELHFWTRSRVGRRQCFVFDSEPTLSTFLPTCWTCLLVSYNSTGYVLVLCFPLYTSRADVVQAH